MTYSVWIVEETDPGHATLSEAGFETDNRDDAEYWAARFNADELERSVCAWAIVRLNVEELASV